jgi:hypothetical protein
LANSSTPLSGSSNFGAPDPTNLASAYSSAAWDIRHNLTTAFTYDVPFGKGKRFGGNMNRLTDTLIGNWHMNGLLSLRTGVPYGLTASCQGVWGRCRPDAIPGLNPNAPPPGGRNPNQYFNIANVATPAPLTGGNLGLQSQTGPPTRNMDFSVFKDIPITERFRMQFRAESFNIANTPQFNIPDANIQNATVNGGNGNFGKITSTQPGSERHLQFSLRMSF